ncbi:MAG TPA: HhH-GPD-type base excision DNA repair protein [Iamia sp.]|nr:HhH-GPD-type base excision DNA repair protein [Iamia sp.]
MAAPMFPVTGDDAADELLLADPLALLIGMLLDQQIPMEKAFRSPYDLAERMGGGPLDAAAIATADPEQMLVWFKGPPALHRFPKAFAERTQAVCAAIVEHHGGRAEALWTEAADGADLLRRLLALPGFGSDKAQIFIALLAKRMDVRPAGWEEAAGAFGDGRRLSVADVDSREAFDRVRAWKKEQKAKAKAAAGAKA